MNNSRFSPSVKITRCYSPPSERATCPKFRPPRKISVPRRNNCVRGFLQKGSSDVLFEFRSEIHAVGLFSTLLVLLLGIVLGISRKIVLRFTGIFPGDPSGPAISSGIFHAVLFGILKD